MKRIALHVSFYFVLVLAFTQWLTNSSDSAIRKANLTDADTVSPALSFTNIHYFAATATKYGTVIKGGYQYEGKSYDAYFAHVDHFVSCVECHDSHTLKIRVEQCNMCHPNVKSAADLKELRMEGSLVDYDGDGDIEEGVYYEIRGLQEMLYRAIQTYAIEKSKTAIVYDAHTYPYFFIDTNTNGKVDADEATLDNKYNAWTARLFRAVYNYQVSVKDPGAFAHGGKYIIQLLYDAIEDLNTVLSTPVDLTKAYRVDDGHFAGSEEPFRHWDKEGEVPAACSKCHSAAGLPLFLKDKATISQPLTNGLLCATCHNDLTTFTRYEVTEVRFPSGAVIDSGDSDTNLCITCHEGYESTLSVNILTEGLDDDQVSDTLRFLNIHFSAGATRFGTKAKGAYEYEGNQYVGLHPHTEDFKKCTDCHRPHGADVIEVVGCVICHSEAESEEGLRAIRIFPTDYDGDGDTEEGIADEIDTLHEALYEAIQGYAKNVAKTPIIYDPQQYPYYYTDTNGNGNADLDEVTPSNQYYAWTPKLLRAAYNYHYSAKDPGGFAHNGTYIIQILYDSLENLSATTKVNMTGMVRP